MSFSIHHSFATIFQSFFILLGNDLIRSNPPKSVCVCVCTWLILSRQPAISSWDIHTLFVFNAIVWYNPLMYIIIFVCSVHVQFIFWGFSLFLVLFQDWWWYCCSLSNSAICGHNALVFLLYCVVLRYVVCCMCTANISG